MKTGISLLALLFWAFVSSLAAEPIKVQVNSTSLFFFPATRNIGFGVLYRNSVTAMSPFDPPNGELELAPREIPWTHWGTFIFKDGFTDEIRYLEFGLDVPVADSNTNLLPDIFEFEPEVSVRTTGVYFDEFGDPYDFNADWSKPTQSHGGLCIVTIEGVRFTHTFHLFEYKGEWTNALKTNGVGQVTMRLPRSGPETGELLEGVLNFGVTNQTLTLNTNSELKLETGAPWRLSANTVASLRNGLITGFSELLDGTPLADPEAFNYLDMNEWIWTISDPNDSNQDGVPDLLETGGASPASDIRLEITRNDNGVRVSVFGDLGIQYTLEDSTVVPQANWQHPVTFTPTVIPHVLDLPAPSATTFWRARRASAPPVPTL